MYMSISNNVNCVLGVASSGATWYEYVGKSHALTQTKTPIISFWGSVYFNVLVRLVRNTNSTI